MPARSPGFQQHLLHHRGLSLHQPRACSASRRGPSASWSSASSCSARCCSTPARRSSSTTSRFALFGGCRGGAGQGVDLRQRLHGVGVGQRGLERADDRRGDDPGDEADRLLAATTPAAIEACASTGGVLMPPIMGATAFVMASFLSACPTSRSRWPRWSRRCCSTSACSCRSTAMPARRGLRGLPRAELPVAARTFCRGLALHLRLRAADLDADRCCGGRRRRRSTPPRCCSSSTSSAPPPARLRRARRHDRGRRRARWPSWPRSCWASG